MKIITISFLIIGNQDSVHGNPIPYTRAIKQAWRADAERYMNWQAFVRQIFQRELSIKSGREFDYCDGLKTGKLKLPHLKPICLGTEYTAKVHTKIRWADKTHGDGDNVHKGILDALFVNDKSVTDGSYTCEMSDNKQGRVEILIEIYKDNK